MTIPTIPIFPLLPLAIGCGLMLAAVAASFFTTLRARAAIRAARQLAATTEVRLQAEVASVRKSIEALSGQMQEVEQRSRVASVPAIPKPGMNLTRRSQALRMHRRGDRPDQIATALEIPLQEVDLLLKVHRIVMSSVN